MNRLEQTVERLQREPVVLPNKPGERPRKLRKKELQARLSELERQADFSNRGDWLLECQRLYYEADKMTDRIRILQLYGEAQGYFIKGAKAPDVVTGLMAFWMREVLSGRIVIEQVPEYLRKPVSGLLIEGTKTEWEESNG